MTNFTEKMRKFCEAKAEGVNNTQAALLAGYSGASAKVQGSTLAARTDVRNEIARLKRKAKSAEKDDADGDFNPRKILKAKYDSPLDLMLDAMNQPKLHYNLRFEAAKQALPYCNPKVESKGKKGARTDAARDVMNGGTKAKPGAKPRFAPSRAPSNVTPMKRAANG